MAIAFDSCTGATIDFGPVSSLTVSHTTSGANRILFVGVIGFASDGVILGVTYGGVSMTLIDQSTYTNSMQAYLYYLIAPTIGANNVIVSASSGGRIDMTSISYTGALQSGVPDASAKAAASSVSATAQSLTTVLDNCFVLMIWRNDNTVGWTAGSGTIRRDDGTSADGIVDGNAAVTPAGSKTLNIATFGTANTVQVIASFPPALATPSITASRRIIITA